MNETDLISFTKYLPGIDLAEYTIKHIDENIIIWNILKNSNATVSSISIDDGQVSYNIGYHNEEDILLIKEFVINNPIITIYKEYVYSLHMTCNDDNHILNILIISHNA